MDRSVYYIYCCGWMDPLGLRNRNMKLEILKSSLAVLSERLGFMMCEDVCVKMDGWIHVRYFIM